MSRTLLAAALLSVAAPAFASLEECHYLVIDPHAPPHALSDCLKVHAHDAPSARSQLYVASKAKLYECMDEGGCAAKEVGDAVEGVVSNTPHQKY